MPELVSLVKFGGLGHVGPEFGYVLVSNHVHTIAPHPGGLRGDPLHHNKNVQELRLDRGGTPLPFAIHKNEGEDVVSEVPLALDLLLVIRAVREGEESGHMEHDLHISPLGVNRVCAGRVI